MQSSTNYALEEIFTRYDLDSNKVLDYPEVKRLLGDVFKAAGKGHPTETDIRNFVQVADINGDGVVSKQELSKIFTELKGLSKLERR